MDSLIDQFLGMPGKPLDCGWPLGTEAIALAEAKTLAPHKRPRLVTHWQIALIDLTESQARQFQQAVLLPMVLLGMEGFYDCHDPMNEANAVLATVSRRYEEGFIEDEDNIYILLGPGRETRTQMIVIECLHRVINFVGPLPKKGKEQ